MADSGCPLLLTVAEYRFPTAQAAFAERLQTRDLRSSGLDADVLKATPDVFQTASLSDSPAAFLTRA